MCHWACACALPVAKCTWSEAVGVQRVAGMNTAAGLPLASPHACCFVSGSLRCTHRRPPCFPLVAMPLHCCAVLLYPQRFNGLSSIAVGNTNAPQLRLPSKPGRPVSRVFWVLRHAVGHLRQPRDPRDRARPEPPVGATCPVTPVDSMISGYGHGYGYIYISIYIYIYIYI